jgi:glycosyltransferase involved in cell wall biosynthesis
MNKITAVIIAKNAEELIADCIDSVAFCSEVVVVDNGSSDRTVELARHMGAKVHEFKTDNFAKLREFGLSKVRTKWVIYVDTDERVDKVLGKSIRENILAKNNSIYNAFKIKRKEYYFGNHEWPQIQEHVRIFNKASLKRWEGALHESPVFEGEAGELDGFLLHFTHRNLTEMVEKTIVWSGVEADLRFRNKHPKMTTWRFFRIMGSGFYDSYIKQKGYKAGTAGLVESVYQGFSMFITYARLWELQNKKK